LAVSGADQFPSSGSQSARFQSLPKDEQVALLQAHKNLGHPSPEKLSTLLRSQGYRAEIAQAALELKCSTCQEKQQPKLARPGSIRDELDFNDRVCMDGFYWTNSTGTKFHEYHIVDWSTNFQCARVSADHSSAAVSQLLIDMWFSWAGSPSEMIVDAAAEFNSEEFSLFMQSNNIKLTTISPEAQYQNGKAERHGSVLKSMLTKFECEHPITQTSKLPQALYWCIRAKNATSLKKGYAPEVLGLRKRTHACLVPFAVMRCCQLTSWQTLTQLRELPSGDNWHIGRVLGRHLPIPTMTPVYVKPC
jgi:transposase InsO family protein